MKRLFLRKFALVVLALAAVSYTVAQDQPPANPSAQTQDQTPPPNPPGQTGDQTPASPPSPNQDTEAQPAATDDLKAPDFPLLYGSGGSLAFSGEIERSNYLRGGIGVGATYDDNATSSVTNRVGDLSYSILPNIALDQTRSRASWTLMYSGGFIANQRLTERNQGSHNLSGSLRLGLSPHVDLTITDNFLATTGFLQQLLNGQTPVTGPIDQPNQVITPLSKTLNNNGAASIRYQFSRDDVIDIGGTTYDLHFRDQPAGSGLTDTAARAGSFSYTHRFGARNWAGTTYRFQQLSFSPGFNRVRTHSLLLNDTFYFKPRMSVSFYAGPEYSTIETQVVTVVVNPPVISLVTINNTEHALSTAAGASFDWQGEHTSARVNFARRVSDGGGVRGAVGLTSVSGAVRHQLRRNTALNFHAFFGNNPPLGNATTQSTLKSASGGASVDQNLSEHLMLHFEYDRDYQSEGSLATPGNINHNRGTISLSYEFSRPLGR